jgi:hypothetical protein
MVSKIQRGTWGPWRWFRSEQPSITLTSLTAAEVRGLAVTDCRMPLKLLEDHLYLNRDTIHQILLELLERGRSAWNLFQNLTYEQTEHSEQWLNTTFKFWERYWKGFRQLDSYIDGGAVWFFFARQFAWPSAMTLKHFLALWGVVEISHTFQSPDLVPAEVLSVV